MTNLLDLRKKVEPQIKVVYRTMVAPRPWYVELAKILAVVALVTTVVWGISRADMPATSGQNQLAEKIGLYGTVTDISDSAIMLKTSKGDYTVETNGADKIETKDYVPLTISDITIGDQIIAQGLLNGTTLLADRIVSFAVVTATTPATATATSTATTTLTVATSTINISSSTATSTSIIGSIANAIGNTVGGIINFLSGSSTEPTASTTATTSTATTTTATTTAPQPEATSTPPVTNPSENISSTTPDQGTTTSQ